MDYLMHYGVKGMKWGVRRYQNKDGTLTSAGRRLVRQRSKKIMDEVLALVNIAYEEGLMKAVENLEKEL